MEGGFVTVFVNGDQHDHQTNGDAFSANYLNWPDSKRSFGQHKRSRKCATRLGNGFVASFGRWSRWAYVPSIVDGFLS